VTPSLPQLEQSLSSLRFGQNAMRVEYKVRANVIEEGQSDEVSMKLIIADYERRIRAIEGERREQQVKREYEGRLLK